MSGPGRPGRRTWTLLAAAFATSACFNIPGGGSSGIDAEFTADPLKGPAPLLVHFQYTGSGADTFTWNFGDGGVSHDSSPVHVYGTSGLFSVSLEVVGSQGTASKVRQNLIQVEGLLAGPWGGAPPPGGVRGAGPFVEVENTGLAVHGFSLTDGRVAATVPEAGQGGADLNGDGDDVDSVLHTFLVGAAPTNLGLAVLQGQKGPRSEAASRTRLLFRVDEVAQGADLNGDGDLLDLVVHGFDDGVVTNLGLAQSLGADPDVLALGETWGAVLVDEAGQGATDLDGDGDALDRVLFLWPPGGGLLATSAAVDFRRFQVHEPWITWAVDEAAQGGLDRNGDGDALDDVLVVSDVFGGSPVSLGLAVSAGRWKAAGDWLAIPVPEVAQGNGDLNGDGDVSAFDSVLFSAHLPTLAVTNLGLAVGGYVVGEEHVAAAAVMEFAQGGLDRNGDGDASDRVLTVIDLAAGTSLDAGLAVVDPDLAVGAGRLVFTVSEPAQGGLDRNGDGDGVDPRVLHWLDLETGAATNLALACAAGPSFDGKLIGFAVPEIDQGFADRNGDSDPFDQVLTVHDIDAGTTTNLALAGSPGSPSIGTSPGRAAVAVDEVAQGGQDLTGDGDGADRWAMLAVDVVSGATSLLNFAGNGTFAHDGDALAFAVSEAEHGADLNGDGDLLDDVLFVARLRP